MTRIGIVAAVAVGSVDSFASVFVKDILTLQGYDIQKLEDQIFGKEVGDDTVYDTNLRLTESQQTKEFTIGCTTK
jgi:hypothetical protein